MGINQFNTHQIQPALNQRGYSAGTADGVFGPRTCSALEKFQRDNGLPVAGTVDQATAEKLGVRH
jgi:peptidoglycan hydrolase-like protein with peptidoglycan-binding domain